MAEKLLIIRSLKSGDCLLFILFFCSICWLFYIVWFSADQKIPHTLIVRSNNEIVANIILPAYQTITAKGPLGNTIILVDGYRARITQDPGPKQYCVLQGWITQAGDIDICLPNQVSIFFPEKIPGYDSFTY